VKVKSEKQQFFCFTKISGIKFLVGPISKICIRNVYQTVINYGWNKTQFQPQYQTVEGKAVLNFKNTPK
jgi:hypothetical protein